MLSYRVRDLIGCVRNVMDSRHARQPRHRLMTQARIIMTWSGFSYTGETGDDQSGGDGGWLRAEAGA